MQYQKLQNSYFKLCTSYLSEVLLRLERKHMNGYTKKYKAEEQITEDLIEEEG